MEHDIEGNQLNNIGHNDTSQMEYLVFDNETLKIELINLNGMYLS